MSFRHVSVGGLMLVSLTLGCALAQVETTKGSGAESQEVKDVRVKMETTRGDIEMILFATKTPMTVANFCNLAKRGYYDDIIFHRVIPKFMAQVGDPQTKKPGTEARWGSGGPGYKFGDEFRQDLKHDKPGVLSMANAGPGTNGSQIFITHVPTPHLDGRHTVFGHVTKGQETVNQLQVGDKIVKLTVIDNCDALFESQKKNLQKWNKVLDQQQ